MLIHVDTEPTDQRLQIAQMRDLDLDSRRLRLADDEVLAGAILDRLLHSATVLNIQGRSYRLKELDEQLSQGSPPQQPLRQHNGGAGADDGKPTETRS